MSGSDPDGINLLDYMEVVVRHRRMIARTTCAAIILSIVVSLLLPSIYSATARILPPQQDSSGLMGMLLGGAGGMGSMAADLLGKGSPADMYVGMLDSEALSDNIIDRFKLMDVYRKKYRVDTYKALDKRVDIAVGKKDGIIAITVDDKDPQRAADMANAYVDELEKLVVRLNITGSGQTKTFLEDRLARAKVDLGNAEEALKAFQSKNKALDVPGQARASIEGIALLKGQLAAQEVQLATLRSRFTDSTQDVADQKAAIARLKAEIASMEGKGGGAIPSVGSVPALGQEFVRLMREFKIQETLVELLTKQYEMAKLSEAKDVAGVQVIQKARVPDRKSRPKRALIVIISTFFAFTAAVITAFVFEYKEKMPQEDRERWRRISALVARRR